MQRTALERVIDEIADLEDAYTATEAEYEEENNSGYF